jgi:ribosomal protein L11 methyltransferase
MPSKWFAIDIEVGPDAAESAESALNLAGCIGTEINNLGPQAGPSLTVTGYFNEPPDVLFIQELLEAELKVNGRRPNDWEQIGTRGVANEDWLAEWKKHWRPTVIGRFVIAPPWSEIADTDKIVIRIEPNMAFGTGTHETTRLCLAAISRLYAGGSFLDVGTGTGVLAIAAAKLAPGDDTILACDTDAASVDIARQNAADNGVGDRIEFWLGGIDDGTPACDFVVANVTLDVILPIVPLLAAKSRRHLVLSGILAEQRDEIVGALAALGFSDLQIEADGEWIAVTVATA